MTWLELTLHVLALVALIVAGGWLTYHAAVIGDEQRRSQGGKR